MSWYSDYKYSNCEEDRNGALAEARREAEQDRIYLKQEYYSIMCNEDEDYDDEEWED